MGKRKINTRDALISGLIGGGIITALGSVLCCIGAAIGGFLGTLYYKSKNPFGVREGWAVGSMCGLIGAVLLTIVYTILSFTTGSFSRAAEQAGTSGTDIQLVFGLVFLFVLNWGFAMLGGVIAGAIFKNK